MPTDPHTLGARIAALRRAQGWSQRRLADQAGVSHGYIALLELGRLSSPSKLRLDGVARALSLRTSDALFNGAAEAALEAAAASAIDAPPPPAPESAAHGVRSVRRRATAALDSAAEVWPVDTRGSASARAEDAVTGRMRPAGARAPSWPPEELAHGSSVPPNVAGTLDQLRSPTARPLPVFRWGSCGDPRDRDSPPDPDHLEYPPPGRETLIGANGFGVVVKGDSMAARGIHDGDVVWVNPERPYALGKVVLALASDVGGEAGMVVKTYARTEVGDCLVSETESGRSPLVCAAFKIIGPVVGITSWRLPA